MIPGSLENGSMNDQMILVKAEKTQNLRYQFHVFLWFYAGFVESMSFLLQGALLNRVLGLTINLTVVRSFWIESHAEEQKCGEFPDIYHFVACFFAGGVPCPQWILEAENNAVVASQNISRRCWFVTPRNTYNNHAHIEASLGVPSEPYINLQKQLPEITPKINLVQIL